MQPLTAWSATARAQVRVLLTDVDDTLTDHGLLRPEAYAALCDLAAAGIAVVPVTGRPAGWCDLMVRSFPVAAAIAESGGMAMRLDRDARRYQRLYWFDESTRRRDRRRLDDLAADILQAVPGTALASDQAYRETDLAIDYCEDVPRLPPEDVQRIVGMFKAVGAFATYSSAHVNGWFGDWDKLKMARWVLAEWFDIDIDSAAGRAAVVAVGDSPNDQPLFRTFENGVGVANVRGFGSRIVDWPAFVTKAERGLGFVELARALLAVKHIRG